MAKRYGRNQRRKHREQIAQMEAYVRRVNGQMLTLQHNQNRAVEDAFDMFMKDTGRIDHVIENMRRELTQMFGEKLMPIVEQIVASHRGYERRAPIAFDARVPYDQSVEVVHVRGEIPQLNYNMALTRY